MSESEEGDKSVLKQQQRRQADAARQAQSEKDELSRKICEQFVALPEYQWAGTVMWYLHCRSEVRTVDTLLTQLDSDKCCVIPYCTVDEQGRNKLGLWRLEDLNELVTGTWGILEPPQERWLEPAKRVDVEELDLIMAPGVAFDCNGGRLGHGAGYYDRLLENVREDAVVAGVCYQAQLLESVAMDSHDVYMDKVITETAVYRGKGR
ncbi:5-formyltetrahydrofolate cyclo-ligase [Methylomarinum sp. Ch1-1]|uniref:5-formyltetrahydrofolate cyclo-ligase n=1 Tax=Methylomarinum roseum TaxID=3067653 RepID=A0AAU7NV21_9GAMM